MASPTSSTRDEPQRPDAVAARFRPARQLALDAFERDRRVGDRVTHLVAPPGSGKTVVGLELVRRPGEPALVLAPTVTIAAQWERIVGLFADGPVEGFHGATYQSPLSD